VASAAKEHRPRLLVADDNPMVRQLIGDVLAREGYEIDAVDDGKKAIEKISADGFDAILLDLMMPVASGFDVIDWLGQNRPEVAKSCVIILTAAVRDLVKFDKTTVYAAIQKPFDIAELRDTVRKCIEDKWDTDAHTAS
jgi:CheY-like chemotaxis protein